VAGEPVANVLIVDDTPSKLIALEAILSPLRQRIVKAGSGREALRVLLREDFALILLDVRMADMDGFETAAFIRERRQSELTPIIFITANASDELPSRDRWAEGAIDFLYAPVHADELRAKVSAFGNLFRKAEQLAVDAREVQAYADQLRTLTDAAPIGIFQTDDLDRYIYTNPHWSALTGVSAEQAEGQPWDSILDSEQRADLIIEAQSAGGRTSFCHRFEIASSGPVRRIVLLTAEPVSGRQGGSVGWVGTLADVTAEVTAGLAISHAHFTLEELDIELAVVARRDPLTGLSNRRALREDLDHLEAWTLRYGHRYALALLAVDLFPAFNDTFGQRAGDHGLRAVATYLNEQLRAGDGLYRYGGAQFLCVFPEQSLASATQAVERMRTGIQALRIPHPANPSGVLTISAGLATLDPESHRPLTEVLQEADDALDRATSSGRNRVEPVTAP